MRSIVLDIISLTTWQKILLLLLSLSNILFSVIDFNHFYNPHAYPYVLQWDNNVAKGIEGWRLYFILLSGVAAFSGVISVVLIMFGKYSNFFWGIINCLTYGAFAIAYSFGGDAQFKLFVSLPLQFFGLWKWNKSKEGSSVRSCSVFQMAILFIIGGGLASGLYYEIPIFTKSITGTYPYLVYQTPRILDSISTACNIIGMFLLVYECWQQYIFWLIVDSIQIAIYAGVGHFGLNINILMMWSVYWISCICGGIIWYRRYQTEKTANN